MTTPWIIALVIGCTIGIGQLIATGIVAWRTRHDWRERP